MKTSKRYWSLEDEIKEHFFKWEDEEDFANLPDYLKASLVGVLNELKVLDAMKKSGISQENIVDMKQEKIKFFNLFRCRYLELTDLTYSNSFSPIDQHLVDGLIKSLSEHGANYVEYLTWFFEEWCLRERNKERLPDIQFVCSNKLRDEYLYKMKNQLKMKKKDVQSMAMRNLLLQIAIPFLERCKNKDLSAKMVEFSEGKMPATKFFELLKAFANKMGDKEAIAKCNEIESKKEQSK